ncbi:MAG: amidophosphoribosyltransferase, partial [Alistipes onderdonkii]
MKLSAVRTIVKGKRVVLVDDSIVRGTTLAPHRHDAQGGGGHRGARAHCQSPMTHPCFYGVDTSTRDELISAPQGRGRCPRGDMRRFAGVPVARRRCSGREPQWSLCMACFTGHYPTALYQSVDEVN